jgi:tetratricopeptide (TPR) repeat protein
MRWSYDLLDPWEQTLFRRLAVFAGGGTLADAERVCRTDDDQGEVLAGLAALVTKSLLQVREPGQPQDDPSMVRYTLLETVREYAWERLAEQGEQARLRRKHALQYLELAEAAEAGLRGPEQVIWSRRLADEHDNLRTALAWACETREALTGRRLAGALWRFWAARGDLSEGRRWLRAVLALPESSLDGTDQVAQVKALVGAALLAIEQGDHRDAATLCAQAVILARQHGEPQGLGCALHAQGMLARQQGRYAEAAACHKEALALAEGGDQAGVADALAGLAGTALLSGAGEQGRRLYERSLRVYRALGDVRGMAEVLHYLARQAWHAGAYLRAEALHEEALALCRTLDDSGRTAEALWGLGMVAQSLGRCEQAVACHEESLALRRSRGDERGAALALAQLGHIALQQADWWRARVLLSEALAILRRQQDWTQAMVLAALGHVELASGTVEQAQALLREGAAICQARSHSLYLPWCLEGLAGVAAARRDAARGARLCGAREALLVRLGSALPPLDPPSYARTQALLRAHLGGEAFAAAVAGGRVSPLEQVLAEAVGERP